MSVIVWEAAGMAPENFSAVFFNESGFWDLASEVSPCISPSDPCNEADGWWGEWRTAFDEQLGDPVQDPASWEHQVYLENLARCAQRTPSRPVALST